MVDAVPPSPSGSPPVPDRIGRYTVVRLLGGGAYGDVYLAQDAVMDRHVAVKVPSARLLATERAREEFLREARSVARIKHGGIVEAYDFGQEPDGRCYIVYELVDGESLAERIKPKRIAADPLPPDEAARIVAGVSEALHFAHLQEIFHRDVKPVPSWSLPGSRSVGPKCVGGELATPRRERRWRVSPRYSGVGGMKGRLSSVQKTAATFPPPGTTIADGFVQPERLLA
jgi:hypothetical protein